MYLFGLSVNMCVCTNRFLRLLIEKLCLPTYCLVDCDPYGFDILTTYRFGSMVRFIKLLMILLFIYHPLKQAKQHICWQQMAYDAKQLHCPEVCWLGVFPSDSEKYCLPQQCFLPLTAEDKKKAEAMLNRCYLQREVPRWRLVMGWIRFLEGGRKFDCINHPNTAHPIPVQVEEVKDIVSVADYILVVEKESVFEQLANDQFCNANRCIVITQMAYDAKQLCCPEVCWLGVFPSDSEKYCLPQQYLLPLTAEDKKKAEAMLNRCYLQREVPRWGLELELMLQRGLKFEIEALSVHSLSFLSKEYITSKIQGGVHI
ncbi:meiotic recombination protein spo11-1 [Quercus suber]|uniref:Meiotic recombination protein spo11-1 n=1 Tax=Quercus suber TaxID=58331 RepID=A0AAW0LNK4_QUESU